jgi:hypothetical protein
MPQNALLRHPCAPSQMDEIFLEVPFSFQVLALVPTQHESVLPLSPYFEQLPWVAPSLTAKDLILSLS